MELGKCEKEESSFLDWERNPGIEGGLHFGNHILFLSYEKKSKERKGMRIKPQREPGWTGRRELLAVREPDRWMVEGTLRSASCCISHASSRKGI